tara:strand:- start:3698 stop:3868 length:171 start_codon:yes stop_codon:yes gene_type:complete
MKDDMKDTVEFVGINLGGIGLSLTELDGALRTLILIATLIYSVQKILNYKKNKNNG